MHRLADLRGAGPSGGTGRVGPSHAAAARRGAWVSASALGLAVCLALSRAEGLAEGAVTGAADVEPIAAVSAPTDLDAAKVALGDKLFHDGRLSGSGRIACASCHDLARGGDDGRQRPPGHDGRALDFNAPTVFNAALNFRLNWRGNFRELEAQNEAALLDPRVMGSDWGRVLSRLGGAPEYVRAFEAAYGRPTRREDVLDALASFQRSLVTPGARIDRYLTGETRALRPDERQGYELFKSYGCVSCHQGRNVGGNLYQRFGIFAKPGPGDARREADLSRFSVTGNEGDRGVFRVPSLRNVAVTAPYLHDGRAATLDQAVAIMGRSQLGIDLPARDVELIVRFLGTLTGEHRGRPLDRGP